MLLEVRRVLTADNTDLLAGTVLDTIPSPGQIDIFAASTQNDTLLTIYDPKQQSPLLSQRVDQFADGMVRMSEQTPISLPIDQGGHPVIAVDIQTAATVQLKIIYRDLEELGLA